MMSKAACLSIATILAVSFIPVDVVVAQPAARSPITIRKVEGTREATPVFAVGRGSTSSRRGKEWFRVFVEYDTEQEWIDELNFTFYVLVRGRAQGADPVTLFKGETSYLHIPAGRRHQADMFIHPNIIARYGDVSQVAVEVRQSGRVIARSGKPEPTEAWWERLAPRDGALLNRGQTPFALIDIDDYEIIKP